MLRDGAEQGVERQTKKESETSKKRFREQEKHTEDERSGESEQENVKKCGHVMALCSPARFFLVDPPETICAEGID